MKCNPRDLLMAHSGELGDWRRHRLQRHLANCPRCAAYARDLDRLAAQAPAALDVGEHGRPAAAWILRNLPPPEAVPPRLRVLRHPAWRPALAAAALLLLTFAATRFMRQSARQDLAVAPAFATAPLSWIELEMDLLHDEIEALRGHVQHGFAGAFDNGIGDIDDLADELLQWEDTLG